MEPTYTYRSDYFANILEKLNQPDKIIPENVMDAIKNEIQRQNITDLDMMQCRRILKKINYRKYYEQIPTIMSELKNN